jgi:hypothetical protein
MSGSFEASISSNVKAMLADLMLGDVASHVSGIAVRGISQ